MFPQGKRRGGRAATASAPGAFAGMCPAKGHRAGRPYFLKPIRRTAQPLLAFAGSSSALMVTSRVLATTRSQ